jgi:hypothetical protein
MLGVRKPASMKIILKYKPWTDAQSLLKLTLAISNDGRDVHEGDVVWLSTGYK